MYVLYVIELRKTVFTESRKFREQNPQFNGVLECLYVGTTSKTPEIRFEQHKKRIRSKKGESLASNIVYKYGMYLRPSLYLHLPSCSTLKEALIAEQELANFLKKQRYAVWVN